MSTSTDAVALRDGQSGSSSSRSPEATAGRELYRQVWEKIGATYFDPARLSDWSKWEGFFDDQIVSVKDAVKFIAKMVASLGDEYTWLRNAEQVAEKTAERAARQWGIGIDIKTTGEPDAWPEVTAVIEGEPASRSSIKVGDVIVTVNNKSCQGLTTDQVVALLCGKYGSRIRMRLERNGRALKVKVMRRTRIIDGSIEVRELRGGIGVVKVRHFYHQDFAQQMRIALHALRQCRAFVLDLRGNEGGLIDNGIDCLSFLIKSGALVTFDDRSQGPQRRLRFVRLASDRISTDIYKNTQASALSSEGRARQRYFLDGRPLVVLVDKDTASTAELVAGTLRDHGFRIFGKTRTFGKAIGQDYFAMPSDMELQVTTLLWYSPNGIWAGDCGQTVKFGIAPTDFVEREGEKGADVVLEDAVLYLRGFLRRHAGETKTRSKCNQ